MYALRSHLFFPQTNGTHLVGQCEISHPVARPLSPEGEDEYMSSLSFDTISPTVSTQSQNVFFGADSKDSYEKLRSPISRTAIRPILDLINSSLFCRTVLHERIWARDASCSHSGIHLRSRFSSSSCIFLWVSLDQVRFSLPCQVHGTQRNSIIPCLALRGVAPAIARSRSLRAKVLFRV